MNELLLQNPTWSGLSALKVRLARSETELANAIARRNQFEEMVRNYSEKMGQDSKDTFSVAQLKRRKKARAVKKADIQETAVQVLHRQDRKSRLSRLSEIFKIYYRERQDNPVEDIG